MRPALNAASPAQRCWLAGDHGQVDLGAPRTRTRPDADGRPARHCAPCRATGARGVGSSRSQPPVRVRPPSLHLRCTPPDPSHPAEIPHDAPDRDRESSRRTSGLAARPELPASTAAPKAALPLCTGARDFSLARVRPAVALPHDCSLPASFTLRDNIGGVSRSAPIKV